MKGRAIDSFLHILDPTLISRPTDSVYYFFIPYQLYQVSQTLISHILTKQNILSPTHFILNNFQPYNHINSLCLSLSHRQNNLIEFHWFYFADLRIKPNQTNERKGTWFFFALVGPNPYIKPYWFSLLYFLSPLNSIKSQRFYFPIFWPNNNIKAYSLYPQQFSAIQPYQLSLPLSFT